LANVLNYNFLRLINFAALKKIHEMKVFSVVAENWKMDGGVAFGVVPRTIWQKLAEPDERNMVKITTRCLLVDTGDRKILFDTGMGRKQNEKYYGYRYVFGDETLEKSLKNIGYHPDDISDVIFTHLHDDHCGGAIEFNHEGTPELVFKNARFYCSDEQWQWANFPNKREAASYFKFNFQPLFDSGKLCFIEDEGFFTDNVELRFFNGHTMGQIIPLIYYNGKKFAFMADFIPSSAHVPIPYVASVDLQPLLTMKEKEAFLHEALNQGFYLIFEHDYHVECCSLAASDKGVIVDKSFRLNEILT
jgi:glyoxylase-like metal-dependent hydrolase (beta-lactamase superfamily II)